MRHRSSLANSSVRIGDIDAPVEYAAGLCGCGRPRPAAASQAALAIVAKENTGTTHLAAGGPAFSEVSAKLAVTVLYRRHLCSRSAQEFYARPPDMYAPQKVNPSVPSPARANTRDGVPEGAEQRTTWPNGMRRQSFWCVWLQCSIIRNASHRPRTLGTNRANVKPAWQNSLIVYSSKFGYRRFDLYERRRCLQSINGSDRTPGWSDI
jgi:hypothetical protein